MLFYHYHDSTSVIFDNEDYDFPDLEDASRGDFLCEAAVDMESDERYFVLLIELEELNIAHSGLQYVLWHDLEPLLAAGFEAGMEGDEPSVPSFAEMQKEYPQLGKLTLYGCDVLSGVRMLIQKAHKAGKKRAADYELI